MSGFSLSSIIRPSVLALKPYSSARDEFSGTASVYLDANENPFNTGYNRYPDPHQTDLKRKIGVLKRVDPRHLLLGNGSDEPIDLLFRAFCEPGKDNVLIPQPTYGMYSVTASINNVEVLSANLTPDFDIDPEALERRWNAGTKLIFLCSPNNPSGNLLGEGNVVNILQRFPGLVVLDEAYIDFTGVSGFLPRLQEFANLVVLQTFSKAWGLAGIRLGMCFASAPIIEILDKIKPPYNISTLTQEVAHRYLDDASRKEDWVKTIRQNRDWLRQQLLTVKRVEKVFRSDANFLLVRMSDARGAYQQLVSRGIIVRDRSSVVLCEDCLRITVGTEAENTRLIEDLKQL